MIIDLKVQMSNFTFSNLESSIKTNSLINQQIRGNVRHWIAVRDSRCVLLGPRGRLMIGMM